MDILIETNIYNLLVDISNGQVDGLHVILYVNVVSSASIAMTSYKGASITTLRADMVVLPGKIYVHYRYKYIDNVKEIKGPGGSIH